MKRKTKLLILFFLMLISMALSVWRQLTYYDFTTDRIVLYAVFILVIPVLTYLSVSLMEFGKRNTGVFFASVRIMVLILGIGLWVYTGFIKPGRMSPRIMSYLIRALCLENGAIFIDSILLVIYIALSKKYNNHVFCGLGMLIRLMGILLQYFSAINRFNIIPGFEGSVVSLDIGMRFSMLINLIVAIVAFFCVIIRYWPSDRMTQTGKTFAGKVYSSGYEYLDAYKQKQKGEK